MNSIIIIGGGAAGLMAAYELSKHNKNVTILEAKSRLGGRIDTIKDKNFSQPIEAGAEFIHGDLPLTLSLLKDAGVSYHPISSKMFHAENGKIINRNSVTQHWDKLTTEMKALKQDMSLADFLNTFFSDGKYATLRESVKNFAGGFDLADIKTASTKSLSREWDDKMQHQFRVNGGYIELINYLETQCRKNGCIIHTNCCVKKINWQQDEVSINTMCSRFFKSNKLVITVPLSVLQANTDNENYIEFAPEIPEHILAAKNIGFGIVIKIILEFTENLWNENSDAGFIFIKQEVPTWWTQLPVKNFILTGWLGGEKAILLKDNTDEEILQIALQSLANAFAITVNTLQTKLKAAKIINWYKEADINGGYSFNLVESTAAKKILHQPISKTIFFSGEALYEGTPVGTVEAALSSGKKTALQVLKALE